MKRNIGLDFLKFLCSFMVICIHIAFPFPLGIIIEPINKIAVPIFFMITGYFYSFTKENKSETRQIKKIATIFVASNILFLFYNLYKNVQKGKTVLQFFKSFVNLNILHDFIFLNKSPLRPHLWYLGAILYVLIILFFIEKKCSREKLYPLIAPLLLVNLILGKYSLLIFGTDFPSIWSRNFLCVGLPFFLIGDILFKIKPKLKSYSLIFLTLLFTLITVLECFILNTLNFNSTGELYLSTIFLSILIFLLAANYGNLVNNWVYKKCCFVGSKLTLGIYILHPIFIDITTKIVPTVIRNDYIKPLLGYIYPILVFLISILVTWVWYIVSKRIKLH